MKQVVLLFSLLIFLTACQQSAEKTPVEAKKPTADKEFANKQFGYTISYPGNWKVKREPDDSNILLKGMISENESFKMEGALGIRVFTFDTEYTTIEAYKANIINIARDTLLDGFQVQAEDFIKLDGKDAVRVIYAGGNGARRSVTMQYYCMIGKRLYIMTGTLNGIEPEKTKGVCKKIAESIKFKEAETERG